MRWNGKTLIETRWPIVFVNSLGTRYKKSIVFQHRLETVSIDFQIIFIWNILETLCGSFVETSIGTRWPIVFVNSLRIRYKTHLHFYWDSKRYSINVQMKFIKNFCKGQLGEKLILFVGSMTSVCWQLVSCLFCLYSVSPYWANFKGQSCCEASS